MKISIVSAALLLLAAGASHAFDDPRVRTVAYEASSVVTVAGRSGFQSSILFGDDEKIENIAVGDSLAWQVTPNKRANVLFLKPVVGNAPTNMTVVTDKRVYLFDLLPTPKAGVPLYSLRFVHADAKPPVAPPAPAPAPDAAAAPAAPAPAPAPPPELAQRAAELNFAWKQQGAPKLQASHVFDDGRAIYLDWPRDAPLPAILVVGPDGSEGPVHFTMRGNTIVVDSAARQLVLRLGSDKATLTDVSARKLAAAASTPAAAPAQHLRAHP